MAAKDSIKALRMALNLQQNEFGVLLDVTTGTVCNWELGRRSPRIPIIRKLLEIAKKNKVKLSFEDFYDKD